MKKAFTLIELLAVIIIIAVVTLIATPTVLSVVEEVEISAKISEIQMIISGARNLYTATHISDTHESKELLKLFGTEENVYSYLDFTGVKPQPAFLKISKEGDIYLSIFHDGTCFIKDYNTDNIKQDDNISEDECGPLSLTLVSDTPSSEGWYNNKIDVTLSTNGIGYKYCIADDVCEPVDTYDGKTTTIEVDSNSSITVCGIGFRDTDISTTVCREYNFDKQYPTLAANDLDYVIKPNTSIDTLSLFEEPIYGTSGGEVECNLSNTSTLGIGNNEITCTATSVSGNQTISKKDVYVCSDEVVNVTLAEGMIPVTISEDGTIKVADTGSSWYNYCGSSWANAVVLEDLSYVNSPKDTVIPMSAIKQMYTYIPRYKYEVFYTDNDNYVINIMFEDKDISGYSKSILDLNSNPNDVKGNYLTHPAFTVDNDELDGIWVGKFEQGFDNEILPNVDSINHLSLSDLYSSIMSFNDNSSTYGLGSDSEVHMIKNSEWGAVTYLSQSVYGLCDNATECGNKVENNAYYTQIEGESYLDIVTGCGGGDTVNEMFVTDINICPIEYRWNTVNGVKASTTNNITGVYDMAGGRREYVMATMLDVNNNFNSSASEFTQIPDSKYIDIYNFGTTSNDAEAYLRGKLGDATIELAPSNNYTWQLDYAVFPKYNNTWFIRSGHASVGSDAGIFTFNSSSGFAYEGMGTRSAMWVYE